jgi:uroporphyrinogen III methyltransferase/synthase
MSKSPSSPKPLLDKLILVACSAKKISALVEGLRELGATVLPFPVIEIQDVGDKRPLDEALASLNKYSWIVFTSGYGVTYFSQYLQERKFSRLALHDVKICAVGPATAKTVKACGFEVDLIPSQFVAEGVVRAFETYYGGLHFLAGHRILIPRAKEARDVLPHALVAAGAQVDIVPCYQTVKAEIDEKTIQQLQAKMPDMIVFTSSSTVRNLIEIMGLEAGKNMLMESTVASLGPITAKTVESFGKRADIVPSENTIASLIEAIGRYYSPQSAVGSGQ